MSYQRALEAAGAEVLSFGEFGSYQGEWWAKVRVNGQEGWVNGSYGSCSGCDSFQAEFGWDDDGSCDEHRWEANPPQDCKDCKRAAVVYQEKLADFGRPYVEGLMTQDEAEKSAARNIEWDSDAEPMLAYVKANA